MLKNTSIKSVLITISAILFTASLVFVSMLWNSFNQIDDSLKDQVKQQSSVIALKNARFHVIQIQQFLTDVGATRNQGGIAEADENLKSAIQSLSTLVEIRPELSEESDQLKKKIEAMHKSGLTMAWEYINNGVEAGNVIMVAPETGLDDTADRLSVHLDKLSDQLKTELDNSGYALSDSITSSRNTQITFAIILMLVVIAGLLLIYLKVEPPLMAINKSLAEINSGAGDLTQRIPLEGNDEIGTIISQFNDFLSLIQNLMRQISMEAENLVSSSNQLSDMSKRTKEEMLKQQTGTDQVATTITQLSATVQDVAMNTQNASETASKSNTETENGKAVVENAVRSIHTLSTGIDTASTVISRVETDCKNVSSVLDVIQSIADQTNLLALNAAIEAARAGEQGRGFAVVADEVRTLASRTQDSTQEIQVMIEQLQRGSGEAVKVMAESQNQAGETVSEIEETGKVLDKISELVTDITDMNMHISGAVNEQKTVVEHINQSVITINDVTASSTKETEKTAIEADQLQGIARNLQTAISQFKV